MEPSLPQVMSDPKPQLSTKDLILHMAKSAEYCGYPSDPWTLTPNEINSYIKTYNERVENQRIDDNYRMAMICATIFNSQRKSQTDKVWGWEDFMPSIQKEQTPEQMMRAIMQMNAAFGGSVV